MTATIPPSAKDRQQAVNWINEALDMTYCSLEEIPIGVLQIAVEVLELTIEGRKSGIFPEPGEEGSCPR